MRWGRPRCQEGLADPEWRYFNLLGIGKRLKGSEFCAELPTGEKLSKTSLALGILFSPAEYGVECGLTKIKVKGSMIASLSAGEEASELTSMELSLSGSKGKQEITKYLNYNEEEVTAKPEANFGLGFESADQAIGSKVALTDLEAVSIPLGEGLGIGGRTFLGDITSVREVLCGGLGLAGAGRALGGGRAVAPGVSAGSAWWASACG